MLKEVTKVSPQVSKNITVPVSGSPKMSNIMQSIANSLPPHLSPVKITFTKPTIQTTNTTTQKVRAAPVHLRWWPQHVSVHRLKKYRLHPGHHRHNVSKLQLCAQHPVQVSQQRRRHVQAGLHLHADHAHPQTDSGVPCQLQPLLQRHHGRSDLRGLLHTLRGHVDCGNM